MSQKELHLIKKNLSYKRIGKKIIPSQLILILFGLIKLKVISSYIKNN